MAFLHHLQTHSSPRGHLTVFEKILPGDIKRAFYIYGAGNAVRGGHRHHKTWNALICLNGSCCVYVDNGQEETHHDLDSPEKCLLLEPQDWHIMKDFSTDAILLVLSNEAYDEADYIYERY